MQNKRWNANKCNNCFDGSTCVQDIFGLVFRTAEASQNAPAIFIIVALKGFVLASVSFHTSLGKQEDSHHTRSVEKDEMFSFPRWGRLTSALSLVRTGQPLRLYKLYITGSLRWASRALWKGMRCTLFAACLLWAPSHVCLCAGCVCSGQLPAQRGSLQKSTSSPHSQRAPSLFPP